MIENPEDIFGQVQNLDEKIARVSLNHLSRIKLLENEIEEHVTASNRHILEIFYTMRTDEGPINGAYDCDGSEYSFDDFGGEQNPYALLVDGKAPVCSYAEYDAEVSTKGSCGKFGLDTVNKTFKVPTLTNILQPTVLASEIGKLVEAGLPNITGTFMLPRQLINGGVWNVSGAFSAGADGTDKNAILGSSTANTTFKMSFNASRSSPLYKDNFNTVQPQTIYTRAMVQLTNAIEEISYKKYTDKLDKYTEEASQKLLAGRFIGETIQSVLPINDSRVRLLNGDRIDVGGLYDQFIEYVGGLYTEYPSLFVTESAWQEQVTTYGSCGKFVYVANEYVRLPKITNIVQGTTDVMALGSLVEAGLPNITGRFGIGRTGWTGANNSDDVNATGSFYTTGATTEWDSGQSTSGKAPYIWFSASRSSPLYKDNFNTVQPQTIKVLYYIVVSQAYDDDIKINAENIISEMESRSTTRTILEIFYSFRNEPSINGAYPCNGTEYTDLSFTGNANPYKLLTQGYAPTCTYEEYQADLDNYGSCGKFALDTTRKTFKVPTINSIIQPTVLASEIGSLVEAGLPNISGYIEGGSHSLNVGWSSGTGALFSDGSKRGGSIAGSSGTWTGDLQFNASRSNPIYGKSNTVQPQTIKVMAYVQLATRSQEISIEQYEQQLSQYARSEAIISGKVIGEITKTLVPVDDACMRLLDGSKITKNGIYSKFCNYIENLQKINPELFCTENDWNAHNDSFGVCPKFVNGADYIRLPKLYSEERYLVKSWKEGTEWYNLYSDGWCEQGGVAGVAADKTVYFHKKLAECLYANAVQYVNATGNSYAYDVKIKELSNDYFKTYTNSNDALWTAYGYAFEVPDQEKIYRYICVATGVKNPTNVTVDKIAGELNSKMDKTQFVVLTQAEYNAITPNENTFYFIKA